MSVLGWLFGQRTREDLRVVVYTRGGCHLCEVAWEQLESLRGRYRFGLEARDIDADPELVKQFNTCVPVIEVNGRVRMRGTFNKVLFQRLLDAKS